MRIFSTFDLGFRKKQHQKYIDKFGKENIFLIKKSTFFLWENILLPFFWWLIVLWIIIIVNYFLFDGDITPTFWWIVGFFVFLWILLNFSLLKKFFDYKIDFIIFTPKSLIRYDQTGFFTRSSKIIELKNLKTVSIRKKGFFNSMFNNWDILFLSEWGFWWESDKERKWSLWEIVFTGVYNPEKYKEEINRFLDLNG